MLTFFPSPYEDELWYGIITRYHVRSGNSCWKYTVQELFPETKGYPRLGDTMPNTTMQTIAAQLPENILSLRDMALVQHCINKQAIKSLANDHDIWQNGKKKQGGSSHAIRSGQRKFTR